MAVLAFALGGCARDVAVTPPGADDQTTRRCAALAGALPATASGQARRVVTPDTPSTAAWGDPPIVYRCGGPTPTGLTPTSQLLVVDGQSWFAEKLTAGYVFSTTTPPYLEVRVPSVYTPEATTLVDFTGVARAASAKPGATP